MKNKQAKSCRYTQEGKKAALVRAEEVGPCQAGRDLGIPESTISSWRSKERLAARKVASETRTSAPQKLQTSPPASKAEKKVAKSYTPSLKARVLEYAAEHGITAAAREFGVTRFTIYDWQRKVELHLEGKVQESPVTGSDEDLAALRDERILKEWRSSPGLGPSQVRNQLRRQGFKVSVHTVRCVLEENGYVTPKTRRQQEHDNRYEAVRPNQLWHLDFLHRHIHKQKVYVLIILDDFSRFITGGALWDGERVGAVIETFSAAVSRHGRPEKVMTDGGSAFHSWRGVGSFTNLLNEMEIDQIVAQTPQTNGKLENLNANIQKELFIQEKFLDLGETQRRFLSWIDFYNFRRTHHSLGGLLVPADRYFGRAEEVLACIESGLPPEGIGQPAAVAERQLDLFRISSHRGQIELYLMGQRLTIPVSR